MKRSPTHHCKLQKSDRAYLVSHWHCMKLGKHLMETEYDFSQGKLGAIAPTPPGKTRITIHLDDEILAWFRDQVHAAGGGNYQTIINDALREYISIQT